MNTDKWLPYYYAAYCYTRISHMNKKADKRDYWVDKAQVEIDKAYEIDPENSEILVMKGFVLQARMDIRPNDQWDLNTTAKQWSILIRQEKLILKIPEAIYGKALIFFIPLRCFGGGKTNAYPIIKTAIEKYKSNPAEGFVSA